MAMRSASGFKLRALITWVFLVTLVTAAVMTHGRQWQLPERHNPWAALSVAEVPGWLTRYKLQRLDDAPALCLSVLEQATMRFKPVADRDTGAGCGLNNAVRIERTSVQVGEPFTLSCPAAVSLALWERHALQPSAKSLLGSSVRRIDHYGSYASAANTPPPTHWMWQASCWKTVSALRSLRIGTVTMRARTSCTAFTTKPAVSSTASSGLSTTPRMPITCTWTAAPIACVVEL